MLTLINFFALLALSFAAPQYAPSGWRPKGTPFVLPREYLPSAPLKNAAQHEINRERFEYIGQYQIREPFFKFESNVEPSQNQFPNQIQLENQFQTQPQQIPSQPQPQPHTTYLTPSPETIITTTEEFIDDTTTTEFPTTTTNPTTENFLKVQGLPAINQPAQFRNINNRVRPLNRNTVSQQSNLSAQNGQLKQLPQSDRNLQQSPKGEIGFVNTETAKSGKQILAPVANTYGAPQIAAVPVVLTPQNTYGSPQQNDQQEEEKQFAEKSPKSDIEDDNVSNENTQDSDEQQVGDIPQTNIAVSNSVNTNGQYYILNPDNLLQRVVFMTSPNREDSGFTAKLRYMPVEPIRDPIYSYNENGQLVRIFRK